MKKVSRIISLSLFCSSIHYYLCAYLRYSWNCILENIIFRFSLCIQRKVTFGKFYSISFRTQTMCFSPHHTFLHSVRLLLPWMRDRQSIARDVMSIFDLTLKLHSLFFPSSWPHASSKFVLDFCMVHGSSSAVHARRQRHTRHTSISYAWCTDVHAMGSADGEKACLGLMYSRQI